MNRARRYSLLFALVCATIFIVACASNHPGLDVERVKPKPEVLIGAGQELANGYFRPLVIDSKVLEHAIDQEEDEYEKSDVVVTGLSKDPSNPVTRFEVLVGKIWILAKEKNQDSNAWVTRNIIPHHGEKLYISYRAYFEDGTKIDRILAIPVTRETVAVQDSALVLEQGLDTEKEKPETDLRKMILLYEEKEGNVPTEIVRVYVTLTGDYWVDHFSNHDWNIRHDVIHYGHSASEMEQYLAFYILWPLPHVGNVGQPDINAVEGVVHGRQEVVPVGEFFGILNFFHSTPTREFFLVVSCFNKLDAEEALAKLQKIIQK